MSKVNNIPSNHMNSILDYQKQLKSVMEPKFKSEINEAESIEGEFKSYLSTAIDNMDKQVTNSSNNIEKLITGDLDNMHTAMIDMNKSQLVLQTAVQVRNKCVESYNDIKNMQF
ncbi:flagellar hook-basal body complex protein FliE [Vagococcus fluvialis]